MNRTFLFGALAALLLVSCKEDDPTPPTTNDFVTGKNRYTTMVDGDSREYYVHVPAAYDGSSPRPVVFMLHGTSGDGEKFYNISGWKEVGEKENLITVYPSSWRYTIIEDGQTSNTTKWHIYPGSFEYAPGQVPRDDIKFLRRILDELEQRFRIDAKRIYLLGFSNGGQMAYRCAVEMGDVLAAVVENAGAPSDDQTRPALRNVPVTFQLGNEDDRFFPSPASLSNFALGLKVIPYFRNVIRAHAGTFAYDTAFTVSGDTNTAVIASFAPLGAGEARGFNIVLVNGLAHVYPNGSNHWMKGAERHWQWLKQYSLP